MSTVRLRPAWADEGAQLAAVRVRAMRESLQAVGRFDPVRARARFLDGFEPADTHVVVFDDMDVGLMVLRRHDPEWLLDHLYIEPGHQGRGIGAKVLRLVFAQADEHQRPVRVGALKDSKSNTFYRANGFSWVETVEWDLYYVRQPCPITKPLSAHLCPLCGQPNSCAVAMSSASDQACWCRAVTFTQDLLARVPVNQQSQACICRACAQGAQA